MRFLVLGLIGWLCLGVSTLQAQHKNVDSSIPTYTDGDIQNRLSKIQNNVVTPRFDRVVRSYVNTYTVKKRERTEAMLGRTVMYFPLFEKMLAEEGMPDDLKYLSVVESALDPMATSRSGAVGLWQFMKPTAREQKLKINRYVDERRDPLKATAAAIKYLRKQYKRFGNWELALAAYNGGPGRVNRAIKRGRSRNFWRIRKHLPRETRNYVPAYIAATYILNYYHLHDLVPRYPVADLQLTETVQIYESVDFNKIVEISGTPYEIVKQLNPAYRRRYIPANRKGNNVTLPIEGMRRFREYFRIPDSEASQYIAGGGISAPKVKKARKPSGLRSNYVVENGDNLTLLAQAFRCTETDIMKWNHLTLRSLYPGQRLVIYMKPGQRDKVPVMQDIASVKIAAEENLSAKGTDWEPLTLIVEDTSRKRKKFPSFRWFKRKKQYQMHRIRRGESLLDIARQYEVSLDSLRQLNDFKSDTRLRPGQRIKIKKR